MPPSSHRRPDRSLSGTTSIPVVSTLRKSFCTGVPDATSALTGQLRGKLAIVVVERPVAVAQSLRMQDGARQVLLGLPDSSLHLHTSNQESGDRGGKGAARAVRAGGLDARGSELLNVLAIPEEIDRLTLQVPPFNNDPARPKRSNASSRFHALLFGSN